VKSARGVVRVGGTVLTPGSPRSAILNGVYFLSADRLTEGGVAPMTVGENMVLPRVERYGLGRRRAASDVGRMMTQLAVRPADPTTPFGSLSGGNQQKVLLSRWLLLDPRVLLLDDPTAGVDPKTRELIFEQLRRLALQGSSIVLRSSEPEHLARLCSRVLVVQQGRIVDQLSGENLTVEEVSRATFT
jgi:ABC-type sugar transport system ATPase subunit